MKNSTFYSNTIFGVFFIGILLFCSCETKESPDVESFKTVFETSEKKETATYQEGIDFYTKLDKAYSNIQMLGMGDTDSGKSLHLVMYSQEEIFQITDIKKSGKSILLINNAIHPGEADGVEASMMLMRDLAAGKHNGVDMKDVVVAVIPFYNIGGALNRNKHTRANQNGPVEYGFRGNARNYDLNRDFIKCDTKNAKSFSRLFQHLDPDLFIDTHTSNGADYQYILSLLYSQKDKLGGPLSQYQEEKLLPFLFQYMKDNSSEMTPYVNMWGQHVHNPTPNEGFEQFADYPRYSTGYAALFHTIGFMTETHMLKPYDQRVEATHAFLKSTIQFLSENGKELIEHRKKSKEAVKSQNQFAITWETDTTDHKDITFKGYEAEFIDSKVTGKKRLYYNRDKPFSKQVPYYHTFKTKQSVERPTAYIIPQGWHNIIELLEINQVETTRLETDKEFEVTAYHIQSYETSRSPYEGHYFHFNTEISKQEKNITFRAGDYYVPLNQTRNRYIIETLEPQAEDSFFKWNFFDTVLQQKEHYSSYVFEDVAEELLSNNPELKSTFEKKKEQEPAFAENARAQLNFLYKNSPHYEPAFMQYPIFRVE